MVFLTLKLVVFKNISEFFNLLFFFLSYCYRALSWGDLICFLLKYKLFCLVSVLSDAILTCRKIFCAKKWTQISDLINVCWYCFFDFVVRLDLFS